jgi:DNA-binding transcriptional ArsR family regulator
MVERLARGPTSVSELARPFDMALPTVVQHLGVLEAAGIVTSTKVGRVRTYQLAVAALSPARDWMDKQRLSTSLTTIAVDGDGDSTRLTYTEQGVHFDGLDSEEGREQGSAGLLDQLGAFLAAGTAPATVA